LLRLFRFVLSRRSEGRRLSLRYSEPVLSGMRSQPAPHCQGDVVVQRAGMRLLFVKTELRKNV
jgi:hypothetical protein